MAEEAFGDHGVVAEPVAAVEHEVFLGVHLAPEFFYVFFFFFTHSISLPISLPISITISHAIFKHGANQHTTIHSKIQKNPMPKIKKKKLTCQTHM